MRRFALLAALAGLSTLAPRAEAFCGFYVARADAGLYNRASQVVVARNGERTVVTMANDYQGPASEFAMVVPVPTVIQQGDVKVLDPALIGAVDAFSAPRLVEYHDPDPCAPPVAYLYAEAAGAPTSMRRQASTRSSADELGVRIEASYKVEEYDVLVLSASQSDGLATWLKQEGYRLPQGAEAVLGSYLQQGMRFFVAKVDVKRHAAGGFQMMRPLQVHYSTHKFMLPIRLGTVNAQGMQDLLVYTLTPHGRVETVNYRTVPLPTDQNVPELVQHEFASFYQDMFERVVRREGYRAVVTEYAWPLSVMCDPCSSDPLTVAQLQALGAGWVQPGGGKLIGAAYLTRLHVRYDAAHFPEDLRFQETRDTSTFQGRYVVQHPFRGSLSCPAGRAYERELRTRQEREAETLASLTGWSTSSIRDRMGLPPVWQERGQDGAPGRDDGSWIPEVPGLRGWWPFGE